MNYFESCLTVEAVKTIYRDLAKKYHPDLGGCADTMVLINEQYHEALKRCSGQSHEHNGKEYTYRYNAEVEHKLMDVINAVLAIKSDAVRVVLIGSWVLLATVTSACSFSNSSSRSSRIDFISASCRSFKEAISFI